MSPPVALAKRWKKIKKRCSFSSSDRLVRSKSFTEQDIAGDKNDGEEKHESHAVSANSEKYLTVGSRDATRFQGLRGRIAQWNSDLKNRRSSENLSVVTLANKLDTDLGIQDCDADLTPPMFVLASPTSGNYVKNKHGPRDL